MVKLLEAFSLSSRDLEELNIKLTLEEIKNMKITTFSNILKKAIDGKALKDLNIKLSFGFDIITY